MALTLCFKLTVFFTLITDNFGEKNFFWITLVCLKTAWDLPADPAANKQHSQIKNRALRVVSDRRSLSTLKLIWCVIYLASEKYTVSHAYFTR